MPFYLTNENIEATMERNPDDIFNPSDINYTSSSRKKSSVMQLISQEIKYMFEKHTVKPIDEDAKFNRIDLLKEDICLSYILKFETNVDEFEIIYHLPFELAVILDHYGQDEIAKIKSELDEEIVVANKELLFNLSNSIIDCLNAEDFAFLQDIEFIDLYNQPVDNKKIETLENLHSFTISINKKEYGFYLQFDKQFNKMF